MDMINIDLHGALGTFKLDVSFKVPSMGVNVLFGPSGCGKTSVLRAIAGLNHISGHVLIGQNIWQDKDHFLPVHKRSIGYVFQEPSLFAHLSVRRNLTYGVPKQDKKNHSHFDEIIEMLGISHLIDRAPYHLSGGERQRVAIGRALLSNPSVLLMDEPLSALDNDTREEILPYLERLRDHLKQPIFYITHDMKEVERLADHLVLINNGSVLSAGKLEALQADLSLPLARRREAAVTLVAEQGSFENGLLTLNAKGGQFLAPLKPLSSKTSLRLRIEASDVSLSVEKPSLSSILNILPCKILSKQDLESDEKLVLLGLGSDGGGAHILARLTNYSWQRLSLQIGSKVFAQIKGVAVLSK